VTISCHRLSLLIQLCPLAISPPLAAHARSSVGPLPVLETAAYTKTPASHYFLTSLPQLFFPLVAPTVFFPPHSFSKMACPKLRFPPNALLTTCLVEAEPLAFLFVWWVPPPPNNRFRSRLSQDPSNPDSISYQTPLPIQIGLMFSTCGLGITWCRVHRLVLVSNCPVWVPSLNFYC